MRSLVRFRALVFVRRIGLLIWCNQLCRITHADLAVSLTERRPYGFQVRSLVVANIRIPYVQRIGKTTKSVRDRPQADRLGCLPSSGALCTRSQLASGLRRQPELCQQAAGVMMRMPMQLAWFRGGMQGM